MKPYQETPEQAEPHRDLIVRQLQDLLTRERRQAEKQRRRWFRPDTSSPGAYQSDIENYRQEYLNHLGWPLNAPWPRTRPKVRRQAVARDPLGTISRLWIEVLPGFETYGLLFVPKGRGPFPLVISQHGGWGTPELCSGFYHNSSNYNQMTRRIWERGCIVFAPQLLLWNVENFNAKYDRAAMDAQFRHLGGTLVGFEIFQLRRALDVLLARRDVDADRVGMLGLSWGGFYTLMTAAAEPRLRAAVSSCFFTNTHRPHYEWTVAGAAGQFGQVEIASLVCPRALYVEVGEQDQLLKPMAATRKGAAAIAARYAQLGIADRFQFKLHPGGHEFDRADDGLDFLWRHLSG